MQIESVPNRSCFQADLLSESVPSLAGHVKNRSLVIRAKLPSGAIESLSFAFSASAATRQPR